MGQREKAKIEFRYYKMSEKNCVMAILDPDEICQWEQNSDNLHFHNCMEIGYCYEGEGIVTIGDTKYRFANDHFMIVPQNCIHAKKSIAQNADRWEYLYVDVETVVHKLYLEETDSKKIDEMLQRMDTEGIFCKKSQAPELAKYIQSLFDIMHKKQEFYEEEAESVVTILFLLLARKHPIELDADGDKDKHVPAVLTKAIDYINEYYMEPIRIETLAEMCDISQTHFRRIFSIYMKMTPLEYINLVRIKKACELLNKTNRPIYEIADKCGFLIPSTFNRNFKRITGSSPIEWRKFQGKY
jgi:AraC-like DNA-binding protein